MPDRRYEVRLTALGRHLDRRGIPDAFIAVEPAGVLVMPVVGSAAGPALTFSTADLDEVAWVPLARSAHPQSEGGTARATILGAIGLLLDRLGWAGAFIVLYGDLVSVEDDATGESFTLQDGWVMDSGWRAEAGGDAISAPSSTSPSVSTRDWRLKTDDSPLSAPAAR